MNSTAILNRFEDVWQQGQRPDIAQYLPDNDRLRLAVLRELVLVDLEHRCKSGERPTTHEYVSRFPEMESAPGFIESLNGAIGCIEPGPELAALANTVDMSVGAQQTGTPEHWNAWFAESPQHAAGGKWPADALARLLLLFGATEFETDETSAIDEMTRSGHLEFRIPFRRLKRVPMPSAN